MRALVLFAVLAFPTVTLAQESPRELIQRAIVAHGGQEKLARARVEKVRLKGTLQVGPSAVAFTNELSIQLPRQYRSAVTIQTRDRAHTVVHLLDGDNAAILLDGQPQPVSGPHLGQLRQTLQLEQALRLVPLLTDPGFTLHPLGEVRYNERVLVGVRVTGHAQRELRIYFDRPTGLVVKTEHQLDGPGGKDVRQETFYGEYREVGGYLRPTKILVLRDGKKVMDAVLVDAQRLDRIDPSEFTR